jgi:superfamily II DNA or RNA helicase
MLIRGRNVADPNPMSFIIFMNYEEFLQNKKRTVNESGFHLEIDQLNPLLFPFQAHCVQTALRKGKFAFFEDCGLGKTFQQIEFAFQVTKQTGCNALILAPLAVVGQTIKEAQRFGYSITEYDGKSQIQISNYEQLSNINTSFFDCIVLDESSIIKNFDGSTRKLIIDLFSNTSYKLACTATPSPNDPMELGNHSEFLNIMPYNEMLAMYFVHDGGDTAKWRLKGHAKERFYEWVSEWAIMLSKPDDIGFPMPGYSLPELNLIERKIKTGDRDNGQLFNDMAVSATNFNQELRLTKVERISEVIEIVNNSTENFIIWVKHNDEAEELRKLIPDSVNVQGSDSPDYKKEKLLGFANNDFRVLITKTKVAAMGMNYQNCHNQIFASPDFSFEGLYQGIRRSYRFGQEHQVNIYLLVTDTMSNVIQSIKNKQKQFEHMQNSMSKAVMKNIKSVSKEIEVREHKTVKGQNFTLFLGDSVKTIKNIQDESVGFSIFSPPFAELYTYSSEIEDMGNSKNYNEFLFAFKFIVQDLFRILWSGRNVAVHCMDLPIQKGKEGYIGLRDFSGMILQAFTDAGFIYHSRVTLWKNPVTEMTRTKALGLLHKQIKKDASMSRVGIPDYLMVFRKPGEHNHPVVHQDKDPNASGYLPVDMWQKIASPVWMDIDYGNTLNLKGARDEKDEKHICPLQLDTIERSLHLWTNKGDTIYTPFAGIGSELYQALKMDRKAIGGELKTSYFDLAEKNCKNAEIGKGQMLFF